MNPFQVVRDFEAALCDYTGAPYAVTTNSCTMALLLALRYARLSTLKAWSTVTIPAKTYCSVPMSAIHAGHEVKFEDGEWCGAYPIVPTAVWDSARRFTSGMYQDMLTWEDHILGHHPGGPYVCCSFHASKILGDTQGGCILHGNSAADTWFRRARFDGRTEGVAPKDDAFDVLGYHCYMSPDVAARLLLKLSVLPKDNEDLPNDPYPDLSKMEIFK